MDSGFSFAIVRSLSEITLSASSQEMRSNVPSPLRPVAFERIEHAAGVIRTLFVVRDLHAEAAVGEGIGRVACYTDGAASVIHINEHGARVRTIVRAYSTDGFHLSVPAFSAAFFIEFTISARR